MSESKHARATPHTSESIKEVFDAALGGSLLENLGKLVDIAQKLNDGTAAESNPESSNGVSKEGEIDLSAIKEGLTAKYSFSAKPLSTAGLRVAPPHRSSPPKKANAASYERRERAHPPARFKVIEPEYDLFEGSEETEIFVQLPGADPTSISVQISEQGNTLFIAASASTISFQRAIELAIPVGTPGIQRFNNGVLSLTYPHRSV